MKKSEKSEKSEKVKKSEKSEKIEKIGSRQKNPTPAQKRLQGGQKAQKTPFCIGGLFEISPAGHLV